MRHVKLFGSLRGSYWRTNAIDKTIDANKEFYLYAKYAREFEFIKTDSGKWVLINHT